MLEIPPLIQITSTIKQGAVYLIEQTHFSSSAPHFFVVLNYRPLENSDLVVVNVTSNVKGRKDFVQKRNFPPETLVEVNQKDCGFLAHNSVFDCNSPHVYTPQDLIERCENGIFRYKDEISKNVLDKLIEGVEASPMVSNKIKQAIYK